MQDKKGSGPGYLVPGTWYLASLHHSHISNLNKAVERILVSKPFIITPSPCYSVTFIGEIPPDIFEQTPYELGQRRSPIGTRYQGPGIWHLGPGTRHPIRSDAEGRVPSTEDRT